MSEATAELTAFIARYEHANNSHDIGRVVPMIAEDATYWLSDGSHHGIAAISAAIERTFTAVDEEVYEIRDLEWVSHEADTAVCRYRFAWTGMVGGRRRSGTGRGTNVLRRSGGEWRVQHEHLSF